MERRRSKNHGLRGKKVEYEDITAGVQDHVQAVTVSESAPIAQPTVQYADASSSSSVVFFPEMSRTGQEERVKHSCRPSEVDGCSNSPNPKRRSPDQRTSHAFRPSSITTLYMASDRPDKPNAQPEPADSTGPVVMEERREDEHRDEDGAEDEDDDDDEVVIRRGWVGAAGGRNEQRVPLTPPRNQRGQEQQQQQQQQQHHHYHQEQQPQQQDHQHQQQQQEHQHQQMQQEHQVQHQQFQQVEPHEQQQQLQQNPHHELQLKLQLQQQQGYHLLQLQHQHQQQFHQQQQQQLHHLMQHPHLQHHHHQHQQHIHQQQQQQQNHHQQQQQQRQHQHGQQQQQQQRQHQPGQQEQQQAAKSRPPRDKAARQNQQTQAACEQAIFQLPRSPVGISSTQSDSAISGQDITSEQRLFYGAHIGSETRNVEFKRGGGEYLRSTFRSHLRRYACAFLNSGGGMLLVGVDDEGVVRGLRCDHRQEDRVRLLVDSVLKFFQPPLLPHCYSLSLLPVVRPGPEGLNLKVLRLALQPPPAHTQLALYQTDLGEVYLRRDGSVEGPLSASAIQEWARQRWSGEVMRLQHCIQMLLAEQGLLLQEMRQQSLTIAALQRAQMPPTGAPAVASTAPAPTALTPITQAASAPPPAAPRLEGLRDRLLKGKLSRRVSLAQTPPQSLSACPSQSDTPILVRTTPASSADHLADVSVSEGGSARQLRSSWLPQGCEGMWGSTDGGGPGPPQCQRGAGTEPGEGTQTTVSTACTIM
ncbi:mediator of RNA polymerase II transcription subunit 15-like isoform X2 [Alosa sapidissima]|uniref:mediator of RNA polymerase II transcription subunit 15-like isoform X2 n=1 Tax=Alosa sapidissima TaxID=34773 RepID=UPI001C08D363|nr:mediator of RNA polymerase II transcription subunit 15-like isoform X2 [Alosa sapidissima]